MLERLVAKLHRQIRGLRRKRSFCVFFVKIVFTGKSSSQCFSSCFKDDYQIERVFGKNTKRLQLNFIVCFLFSNSGQGCLFHIVSHVIARRAQPQPDDIVPEWVSNLLLIKRLLRADRFAHCHRNDMAVYPYFGVSPIISQPLSNAICFNFASGYTATGWSACSSKGTSRIVSP